MPKFIVKVSQKRFGSIIVQSDAETEEELKQMFDALEIEEGDIDPDYDDGSQEMVVEEIKLLTE